MSRHLILLLLPLVLLSACKENSPKIPRTTNFKPAPLEDFSDVYDEYQDDPDAEPFMGTLDGIEAMGGKLELDSLGYLIGVELIGDDIDIEDSFLGEILKIPALKKLKISSTRASRETLHGIENQSELEELWLQDTITECEDIRRLAESLPKLKRFRLRRTFNVLDEGFSSVLGMKDLQTLELITVRITGESLAVISGSDSITCLDLRECNDLLASDYRHVLEMDRLQELRVGGVIIGDNVIEIITAHSGLNKVTIAGGLVSREGIVRMFQDENFSGRIEKLEFTKFPNLDDEVFSELKNFPKLDSLVLRSIPVRGNFLEEMLNAPNGPPPIETFYFDNTFIGEDSIPLMKKFPKLKNLSIDSQF